MGNLNLDAGTLTAETWENSDGTENYKCRAWVNFNGTGVPTIRASGNVSSITDNGTGKYTVNFTTSMPDANYSPITAIGKGPIAADDNIQGAARGSSSITTSSYQFGTVNANGSAFIDVNYVHVAIIR